MSHSYEQALATAQVGDLAGALAILTQLLAEQPEHVAALALTANLLLLRNQIEQARPLLQKAVHLAPNDAFVHYLLSELAMRDGNVSLELQHITQAVKFEPENAKYYAQWLKIRKHYARDFRSLFLVLKDYDWLFELEPNKAEHYHNRADLLKTLGLYQLALTDCEKALQLSPNFALAWANRAMILLALGRYKEGWAAYEWRFNAPTTHYAPTTFPLPRWQGENIGQAKLLIYAEQGLGDNLQFVRFAIEAKQRGLNVVVVNHQAVENLLHYNLTRFGVPCLANGASASDLEYYVSMMSLPHLLDTELDTIPLAKGYIQPEPSYLAKWQVKLGACNRPRIGLVWAGSKKHNRSAVRNLSLADLAPLLTLDAEFHCLQKEIEPTDRNLAKSFANLQLWDCELADFSDTCGLAAQLDLVISVDTSVAHLAAAMGKPTWILLNYYADFRWLVERDDSPWYHSVQLFRQGIEFDWQIVIQRIKQQLQQEFHLNEQQ